MTNKPITWTTEEPTPRLAAYTLIARKDGAVGGAPATEADLRLAGFIRSTPEAIADALSRMSNKDLAHALPTELLVHEKATLLAERDEAREHIADASAVRILRSLATWTAGARANLVRQMGARWPETLAQAFVALTEEQRVVCSKEALRLNHKDGWSFDDEYGRAMERERDQARSERDFFDAERIKVSLREEEILAERDAAIARAETAEARLAAESAANDAMVMAMDEGSARVGEHPSSEFSPAAIAVARADGNLRVDRNGLGWIRNMAPEPMTEDKLRMLWLFARADEKRGYLWLGDAVREIDRLRAENAALTLKVAQFCETVDHACACILAPKTGMRVDYHGDFAGSLPSTLSTLGWWVRELRSCLPQPPKGSDDGE